jgi:hypothetical protein
VSGQLSILWLFFAKKHLRQNKIPQVTEAATPAIIILKSWEYNQIMALK